jgi:hypothetical protein
LLVLGMDANSRAEAVRFNLQKMVSAHFGALKIGSMFWVYLKMECRFGQTGQQKNLKDKESD